jgi:hypothetical protein
VADTSILSINLWLKKYDINIDYILNEVISDLTKQSVILANKYSNPNNLKNTLPYHLIVLIP